MKFPSRFVLVRTMLVAVIAACISISISTGICYFTGAVSDNITIFVRLVLPFLIAFPLGFFWFSRLEKLEQSYSDAIKRANELTRIASLDPLTGLLNRRSFIEQFNAASNAGVRGVFLLADIDHLKAINDKYGHIAGDNAVLSASAAMIAVLPNGSLISRVGGDEFCAFIPKACCSDIKQMLDGINSNATDRMHHKRPDIVDILTLSVGMVACKTKMTFEGILALADQEMYRKKRNR